MGTRVRIEIPNATGTGPVLDEDDLARLPGERSPILTNRHYILDKITYGHVLILDDQPIRATLVEARLDVQTVVLTLDVAHDDIAALIAAHGDPAPGYAAVMYGKNGLQLAEVGLAPPLALPEPEAGNAAPLPPVTERDHLVAWLAHRLDDVSERRGAPRRPYEESLGEASAIINAIDDGRPWGRL